MAVPDPNSYSTLRKLASFASIGVILAALYVAWTFYSRHESETRAQRDLDARHQAALDSQVKTIFGSGEIRINSYSIDKAVMAPGETATLCYGVENATHLKLDPPVEPVKPSGLHCLQIAPRKTTTYTITASDDSGHSKAESLTVRVR